MKSLFRRAAIGAVLCGIATAGLAAADPAQLATKSGCMACHFADKKLVGPAFKEIAVKYKGRADAVPYLTQRVRKGGPGNWGVIPMVPNDVSKLSDADLKTLLNWILGMAP